MNAASRRRLSVELPPEDYKTCDEHRCGLLKYGFVRDARRRTKLRGKARDDSQQHQLEEKGSRARASGEVASRANTSWPLCTGMTSRLVDVMQRWNATLKMTSRIIEIKKQVTGVDADLEKSGRVLIRVIEW